MLLVDDFGRIQRTAVLSREPCTACRCVKAQMKTAAGQCCFYPVPERDAQGIGRHYAVRTYETLCDDWLVLHKARTGRCRSLRLPAERACAAAALKRPAMQQPHELVCVLLPSQLCRIRAPGDAAL